MLKWHLKKVPCLKVKGAQINGVLWPNLAFLFVKITCIEQVLVSQCYRAPQFLIGQIVLHGIEWFIILVHHWFIGCLEAFFCTD